MRKNRMALHCALCNFSLIKNMSWDVTLLVDIAPRLGWTTTELFIFLSFFHFLVYMWWLIRNLSIEMFCVLVMMICNSTNKIDYMLIYNFDFYCRREFCWQDWWYADPQLWLLLWKRILLIRLIIYMMLICNFDFYCRREFC